LALDILALIFTNTYYQYFKMDPDTSNQSGVSPENFEALIAFINGSMETNTVVSNTQHCASSQNPVQQQNQAHFRTLIQSQNQDHLPTMIQTQNQDILPTLIQTQNQDVLPNWRTSPFSALAPPRPITEHATVTDPLFQWLMPRLPERFFLVYIPGGLREIAQVLPGFVPEGVLRAPEPLVKNGEPEQIPQQYPSQPVDDIDDMFNFCISQFDDFGGS
jgi:hypothetical protein